MSLLTDASEIDQLSNSHFEEGTTNIWKGNIYSSFSRSSFRKQNILMCLQGREQGFSWRFAHPLGGCPGRNREKWLPFLEGRALDHFVTVEPFFSFTMFIPVASND